MRLVLDTGAFLAIERGERKMWTRLRSAQEAGSDPLTHGGVVGQAWRGRGAREALLARGLALVEVRALDRELGRRAGVLLAKSRTNDVIDAAVVLLAADGDRIVTSDPDDIGHLVRVLGREIEVVAP